MKTVFRLIALLFAAIPVAATAQTNIRAAFDAIIKCPEARVTESHSFEKDPGTNKKVGQLDIYRFALPAKKSKLIKNVISAFEKDSDMAYSQFSGHDYGDASRSGVAVGSMSNTYSVIISEEGSDYIYSLFLAPISEDPEGIYRYAYAMCYKDNGGEITGQLTVTYATTLQYRQQSTQQATQDDQERKLDYLRKLSNISSSVPSQQTQQTWFETLMSYIQTMSTATPQTRIALATKAYKLIQDVSKYPDATAADKNAAREIIKSMLSDKKYSETILNQLLNQCLVGLK